MMFFRGDKVKLKSIQEFDVIGIILGTNEDNGDYIIDIETINNSHIIYNIHPDEIELYYDDAFNKNEFEQMFCRLNIDFALRAGIKELFVENSRKLNEREAKKTYEQNK